MPSISGTVKDATGAFTKRVLRAYRRSDGVLSGQVSSDAITGAYSITTIDSSPHFVIAFDGTVTDGDPYWSNVALALDMDGAEESTSFIDTVGNTITASGGAVITTATSQFGGASGKFTTSGAELTIPASAGLAFGTVAMTVEGWFKPTASSTKFFYANGVNTGGGIALAVSTNQLLFRANGQTDLAYNGAISSSLFSHIAFVRSGNTRSIYLGGVAVASDSLSYNQSDAQIVHIGSVTVMNSDYRFLGHIDDLRISKNLARYTGNFTPPGKFPSRAAIGTPVYNALILDNVTPL